jgi:hypothetical protein
MSSGGTKCCITWCWIIQVLLWASIIFFIFGVTSRDDGLFSGSLATLITFYVIYVISNLCSPAMSYLCHKHGAFSIHNLMKQIFYNPPTIRWHVECYHYETSYHTHTDSNGNTRTETKSNRVTTFTGSRDFHYYTWRDVSGLFLLDSHKVYNGEKKVYIKLELNLDVDFADDITRLDYQRQKDDFYYENRWRDTHISFSESKIVNGFNQYNMVRISDYRPAGINCGWFLIFTFFFPFAEIYKMYVDSFCIDQDYTVKKVVSSRYNLQVEEHAQKWVVSLPTLVIFNQPQIVYNEAPNPIHNSPVLPSMEELEQAKNFSYSSTGNKDNYTPHFQKESPSQGGMMSNFTEPQQTNTQGASLSNNSSNMHGGMMTNFSQPVTNPNFDANVSYNSSNAFKEPFIGNNQVNLNVSK